MFSSAAKRNEGLKKFSQRLVYRRGAAKTKWQWHAGLLLRDYTILRDGTDYEEFLRRGVEARPSLAVLEGQSISEDVAGHVREFE